MATSVPPPKAPPGWAAVPSAQNGENSNALEIGMSGMSLESNFSGGSRPPFLSGSSVSSDPFLNANHDNSENSTGTPPSPGSPLHQKNAQQSGSQPGSKPPGLGMPLPSPIGKGSITSNTTSSPHLSLTPSSADGNIDYFGMGKQSSPYGEGASLPTPPLLDRSGSGASWGEPQHKSQSAPDEEKSRLAENERNDGADTRKDENAPAGVFENDSLVGGLGDLFSSGSFDRIDHDDGLHGLNALRDRSHSSPGPFNTLGGMGPVQYSSSPGLYRESSPVRGDGSVGSREDGSSTRQVQSDLRRGRSITKDSTSKNSRPPLSRGGLGTSFGQPHDLGASIVNQGDRSFSSASQSVPHSLGYGNETFQNQFGNLSRPDLRYTSSEGFQDSTTSNRSRSASFAGAPSFREYRDTTRNIGEPHNELHQHQLRMDQLHSQKFASPQTLTSHIQHQQRVPPHPHHSNLHHMQHPQPGRHVRSFSQPGPLQHSGQGNSGAELLRHMNQLHVSEHRRDHSGGPPSHIFEGDSVSSLEGSRYGRLHNDHNSRSVSAGTKLPHIGSGGLLPRGGSQSHPSLYDGHSQAKPTYHSHVSHGMSPGSAYSGQARSHRQQSPDSEYQGGRMDSAVPVMATPDELRIHGLFGHESERHSSNNYRSDRMVSPSESPLNMTVGGHAGHIRQFSDGTGMSTSPVSLGSARGGYQGNMVHNAHLYGQGASDGHHRRRPSYDDDLTHPLAGEHIDDPEDEYGASMGHPSMNVGVRSSSFYGGDASSYASHHSHQDQVSPVGVPQYSNSMDYMHLQRQSNAPASQAPKAVYNVKFKRTQRCFIAGSRITRDLKVGCYVKVEADRGEDLGIVVSKIAAEKYSSSSRSSFRGLGSTSTGELTAGAIAPGTAGAADLKRIIRLATHDEVSLLSVKREDEDELLKICRGKVRQRGLPMNVVDAEYQYDRHKLTFFFEAEGRIDFRELVRDLFSMYKTRIWMQQLDKSSTSSIGPGTVTPSTGSVDAAEPEF